MVKNCQESWSRTRDCSVTNDQRLIPEHYVVKLLFAASCCTQGHVYTLYIICQIYRVVCFSSKSPQCPQSEQRLALMFFKDMEKKRADRQFLSRQSQRAGRQSGLRNYNTYPPSSSCHLSVDAPGGWLPWRYRLPLSIIGPAAQGRGLGVFLPPGVCLRICLCVTLHLLRSRQMENLE